MTGFGRTGTMFAFEHWSLEPDLVTVAKSLSGGYVPVGALLMSRAVHSLSSTRCHMRCRTGRRSRPTSSRWLRASPCFTSFKERGLVERSAQLGERLLERTRPLVDEFDVVRDVRGIGLMWAIEFEGDGFAYRMLERAQRGLFAQLVVVPLFTDHRILTAGRRPRHGRRAHPAAVRAHRRRRRRVRRRPARDGETRPRRMPSSLTKFALTAAGIR